MFNLKPYFLLVLVLLVWKLLLVSQESHSVILLFRNAVSLSLFFSITLSPCHSLIRNFFHTFSLSSDHSAILSFGQSSLLWLFQSFIFAHYIIQYWCVSLFLSFWQPFILLFQPVHQPVNSLVHSSICVLAFLFVSLFDDVITWLLHLLSVSLILGLCICWWSKEGHNEVPYEFYANNYGPGIQLDNCIWSTASNQGINRYLHLNMAD